MMGSTGMMAFSQMGDKKLTKQTDLIKGRRKRFCSGSGMPILIEEGNGMFLRWKKKRRHNKRMGCSDLLTLSPVLV